MHKLSLLAHMVSAVRVYTLTLVHCTYLMSTLELVKYSGGHGPLAPLFLCLCVVPLEAHSCISLAKCKGSGCSEVVVKHMYVFIISALRML